MLTVFVFFVRHVFDNTAVYKSTRDTCKLPVDFSFTSSFMLSNNLKRKHEVKLCFCVCRSSYCGVVVCSKNSCNDCIKLIFLYSY